MLLEHELPCVVSDIASCLAGCLHPIERIDFEVGTTSQHLFFSLKAEGFDVVCMEARQVNAALSAMRNKTNKNDARGIAQVLRTGWFSRVHKSSHAALGARALLSTRIFAFRVRVSGRRTEWHSESSCNLKQPSIALPPLRYTAFVGVGPAPAWSERGA